MGPSGEWHPSTRNIGAILRRATLVEVYPPGWAFGRRRKLSRLRRLDSAAMPFRPGPDYWLEIPTGRYRVGLTPDEAGRLAKQSVAWLRRCGTEFSLNDAKMLGRAEELETKTANPEWAERYLLEHHPAREVQLASFAIARRPLTNREYREFMADTGETQTPSAWRRGKDDRNRADDAPAQGLCWWLADALARWAGARLPFEDEWERAVRGPEHSLFPWGDTFEPIGPEVDADGYQHVIPVATTRATAGGSRAPAGRARSGARICGPPSPIRRSGEIPWCRRGGEWFAVACRNAERSHRRCTARPHDRATTPTPPRSGWCAPTRAGSPTRPCRTTSTRWARSVRSSRACWAGCMPPSHRRRWASITGCIPTGPDTPITTQAGSRCRYRGCAGTCRTSGQACPTTPRRGSTASRSSRSAARPSAGSPREHGVFIWVPQYRLAPDGVRVSLGHRVPHGVRQGHPSLREPAAPLSRSTPRSAILARPRAREHPRHVPVLRASRRLRRESVRPLAADGHRT